MMNDVLSRFQDRHNGHCLSGVAVFAIIWGAIPVLRSLNILANDKLVLSGFERVYRGFFHIHKRLQPALISVKKKR